MPVSLDTSGKPALIRVSGITAPDEADALLELVRENPGAAVDLSELEHLHTALLQIIMVARLKITAYPEDPFWALCIEKEK